MKFSALLLIAVMPIAAFARIGETREQCDKRYGKVTASPLEHEGIQYLAYRVHGFAVDLNIIASKCEKIKYIKEDYGMLAKEEIEALLNENGTEWQQVSKHEWKNQQSSAKVSGKYLVITSKVFQKHVAAKK